MGGMIRVMAVCLKISKHSVLFGLMKIDAHVHLIPPGLKSNFAIFANEEPYWHLLLNPPNGRSIQGYATPEMMLRDMDTAGIERVVLVGEYFRQHANCVQRNDAAIKLVRRWPSRILALAALQPSAGLAARDELTRCLAAGMVGVGELNPYAQGFRLDDDAFLALAEQCVMHDVPLNLHVSEEIGGFYPGKSTTPLRHYYELACRLPDLKLILAHWGGGLFLYELMPEVKRRLRNVWYDTAATPLLFPVEKIFRTALTCIDHRKLLYGSDYPLRIYPRAMHEPDLHTFLHAVQMLNLNARVEADILGNNAARLFGLLDSSDHRTDVAPAKAPVQRDEIGEMSTVAEVVARWPQTADLFRAHHIPTVDQSAPRWEPIIQAAAAQGLSQAQLQTLLMSLKKITARSR